VAVVPGIIDVIPIVWVACPGLPLPPDTIPEVEPPLEGILETPAEELAPADGALLPGAFGSLDEGEPEGEGEGNGEGGGEGLTPPEDPGMSDGPGPADECGFSDARHDGVVVPDPTERGCVAPPTWPTLSLRKNTI